MNDVIVHHEVRTSPREGWQLCFQWVTYTYDDRSPSERGYRFIWRRPDGTLQPARGQARIPGAAELFELLQRATSAGWFVAVESIPPLQHQLAFSAASVAPAPESGAGRAHAPSSTSPSGSAPAAAAG